MLSTNKICFFSSLAMGLALTIPIKVAAETNKITNLNEFYSSYESNIFEFDDAQKDIIEGIFDSINPYLKSNGVGLQNAIDDGFIPFTPEWEDHGIHWFNPTFVDLANMQVNPLKPSGLNMSHDGELLGVFWAEELYKPSLYSAFQQLQQSGGLDSLTAEEITQIYTGLTATETEVPDDFDVFSDFILGWHKHENVIIENLDLREDGSLDPQKVDFRQSLTDENFINEVLASINDPDSILSPLEVSLPLEFDSTSGYSLNRGVSGGFHMLHMWLGLENDAGLFAGTNKNIEASAQAISESKTFEDGSDGHEHGNGHGHGMEGGNHGGHSQSVPEPSFIGAMLALVLLSVANKFKKYSKAIH